MSSDFFQIDDARQDYVDQRKMNEKNEQLKMLQDKPKEKPSKKGKRSKTDKGKACKAMLAEMAWMDEYDTDEYYTEVQEDDSETEDIRQD